MFDCVKETNEFFIEGFKSWIQAWRDVEWPEAFRGFCQNVLPVIAFLGTTILGMTLVIYGIAWAGLNNNEHIAIGLPLVILGLILSLCVAAYPALLCANCAKKMK